MDADEIITTIERSRLILILRHVPLDRLEGLAQAFQRSGVRLVEVALNSENALEAIERFQPLGFLVGAGTAVEREAAEAALKAGVRFLLSPTWEPFLPELCSRYGAVAIPGAFTPTEIWAAYRSGAPFIKVFPASALGPQYLKAVLAPLPGLRLIPVGGVGLENAADFLKAGAAALGVGSNLVKPQWVAEGRFDLIAEQLTSLVRIIEAGGRSGGRG